MWQDGSMADDGRRADTVLYLPFPLCLNLGCFGCLPGVFFPSFFSFSFDLGPLPFATKPPTPLSDMPLPVLQHARACGCMREGDMG